MLNDYAQNGGDNRDPRADDLVQGQADQNKTGIVGHNVGHLQASIIMYKTAHQSWDGCCKP